ncbi:spermidine/putrescine transport system permease protein [Paenibacillus shirakamiensis]|uniref:Spermidine/putrescine transport system permease protein n=1 Tax=Paenibacillus shirakamiensis TaxID=1265935 RepID=A0ABS4JIA3_9BACL|nr:ABC transporter permease [Paenibacillus shirakamiensis]MBP2001433.1 spermidine/putrescine transport system permease protein [Paenibacillus shirakamiensis]
MRTKRSPWLGIHALVMLIFIYVPIAMIILFSFNESRLSAEWSGFTLDWYTSLFQNEHVMDALKNTLIVAITSTVAATILGTLAAIGVRRVARKLKLATNALLYLPIVIPDIIMGISLLVLFNLMEIDLSRWTIIIAHITFSISYVYVVVTSRLSTMGKQLEEAAEDLGASPWQTFRFVTLPQILPGVVSGAIIAFTMSLDDFMVSFFVAGPSSTTLPIYIYGQVKRGISPEINALCTLLILVSVALIFLAQYMLGRGKGQKKQRMLPF